VGQQRRHYPSAAYETAFAIILRFQLVALTWFLTSEFLATQANRIWIKDSS
jgi:hypothetical protein